MLKWEINQINPSVTPAPKEHSGYHCPYSRLLDLLTPLPSPLGHSQFTMLLPLPRQSPPPQPRVISVG